MAIAACQHSKDRVFLSAKSQVSKNGIIEVSLESQIVSFVLCYSRNNSVEVFFVGDSNCQPAFAISCDPQIENNAKFIDWKFLDKEIQDCKLPAIQSADGLTCAAGLCAVLRWTFKSLLTQHPDHYCKDILGFRGGCLTACSEVSVWTRFCEVDFVEATKQFASEIFTGNVVNLSEQLVRFENHLKVPVRTYNILKRKQDLVKTHKATEDGLHESILALNINDVKKDCTDLELQHAFSEGIDKTLSDIILWPCIHIQIMKLRKENVVVEDFLPRVCQWYDRLCSDPEVQRAAQTLLCQSFQSEKPKYETATKNIVVPQVAQESLYSRDPKRGKTKVRHHDPTNIIQKLKKAEVEAEHDSCPSGMEEGLDWHSLPLSVHPAGGDLPLSRVERKCQQVESIVLAALDLAAPGQRIIDFCSGGGHVGLLLAYYLPKCQIILIENKEASLERARTRAANLDLDNVKFYQCNLDYFQGQFDLAVALHACGVATDLVIDKCLTNRAAFVCCPCCYGAVREKTGISYPRSNSFKKAGVSSEEYIQLCHFADRTEVDTPKECQGKLCMTLVDIDRCSFIKELNYGVQLCTLQPPDCTPKSNVIIATPIK